MPGKGPWTARYDASPTELRPKQIVLSTHCYLAVLLEQDRHVLRRVAQDGHTDHRGALSFPSPLAESMTGTVIGFDDFAGVAAEGLFAGLRQLHLPAVTREALRPKQGSMDSSGSAKMDCYILTVEMSGKLSRSWGDQCRVRASQLSSKLREFREFKWGRGARSSLE